MNDSCKLGERLNTSPQKFSAFSEFDDKGSKEYYRLGYIPSLTESIVETRGVKTLVAVFFRVCNCQRHNAFLTFLAYHNCNEEFEFPFIELDNGDDCLETKASDLIAYVSKRSKMKYVNKVGYAGFGKMRYVLCEVLNNDVPYDCNLPSSFSWLSTGEIVQNTVMGITISDTIRLFIQEVTGACRLFKNETIIPGPKIAYLVCEDSNYKKLHLDLNLKFGIKDIYWFSDYDLALLNGFFGASHIESQCVLRSHQIRNRFHILRLVLPAECAHKVAYFSLELEDMEPKIFLNYQKINGDVFVISKNIVVHTGKSDIIYNFLNNKTKPFFLS